ncbi:hypothetical protein GUJ93_ZPchr0005g14912 [Zizania palustris]|uniref:Uncharacterized protein n=1 Tax=Zizania palustris TaxID=103762 RepID=A0A8J5TA03_ZIZPA|nr:hypothetical protein GUJ93_ZPchr0005g14912 [Zizania palustris]
MGYFLGCFRGGKERRRRWKHSSVQSPSGRARTTPWISPKKVAALDGYVVSATAPLLATLLELRDSTDDLCLTVVTSPEAPPLPHPTRDGNPVLSSMENLSQWKEAKSHVAPKALDKENMVDLLSEPTIPAKKKEWQVCSDYTPSTPSKQEASVDASL